MSMIPTMWAIALSRIEMAKHDERGEITEDLDTTALLAEALDRNVTSTAALLATAPDAGFENLSTVAFTVFSGIAGCTRIAFERGVTPSRLQELRRELSLMCRSYLLASRQPRQAN